MSRILGSKPRSLILFVLPLLLLACTAKSQMGRGVAMDRLNREQLSRYTTPMEAIQALRSNWLRQRSPLALFNESELPLHQTSNSRASNPVWIYRDGTRLGEPDVLSRLSTSGVESIEYFDAASASRRWGPNHENGVIHLTSK